MSDNIQDNKDRAFELLDTLRHLRYMLHIEHAKFVWELDLTRLDECLLRYDDTPVRQEVEAFNHEAT